MFGFLSPSKPSRTWRQSYARVCQYQRRMFGITSLPFLSYEAVFLYQVATDLDPAGRLPMESVTCCRLRSLEADVQFDRAIGEFAAAFGLFLAGVKFRDELKDSGRWYDRLLWWKYRRQVTNAADLLDLRSPGLMSLLSSFLARHAELEDRAQAPTLDELVVPTGKGFAQVFRAAGELSLKENNGRSRAEVCEAMSEIGRHAGQAIIAWDCAVDFEYDRLQNQFTPLKSLSDVQTAFDMCQLELVRAAMCLPAGSAGRELLSSVLHRVAARQAGPAPVCSASVLERWGVLRQPGRAYARCECPLLCAIADCATCCASAISHRGPQVADADGPSVYLQFVGQRGVTVGALSPVGFVRIGGTQVPARVGSGEHIESNVAVMVLSADDIGVTVERT